MSRDVLQKGAAAACKPGRELITNGGLEFDDGLAGWTQGGKSGSAAPQSSDEHSYLLDTGHSQGYLKQAVEGLVPGLEHTLTLSLRRKPTGSDVDSHFSLALTPAPTGLVVMPPSGGDGPLLLPNEFGLLSFQTARSFGWTRYILRFRPTSQAISLSIIHRSDAGFFLKDVSLRATCALPGKRVGQAEKL